MTPTENLIYIHGFETDLKGRDWCVYSPLGGAQYTVNREPVKLLSAVQPMEGRAAVNPAVQMAHLRWNIIRPRYEAWKAGQSPDIEGTPLSAWNAVSAAVANILKSHGIYTVEEVAKLTDTHFQRMKIHNLRDLTEHAKRFVATADSRSLADAMEKKDAQIAEQNEKLAEMERMIRELMAEKAQPVSAPKPRGRPRKAPAEQAAA